MARRFIPNMIKHFMDTLGQSIRVSMMCLDWHWMQGLAAGDWVKGYLSGSKGSSEYYLLKDTIPQLFDG